MPWIEYLLYMDLIFSNMREGGYLWLISISLWFIDKMYFSAWFVYILICHLGNVNNTEEIKDGQCQPESKDGQLSGESKDNRSLIDNNTAQSLTGEDIEDMRRSGHFILFGLSMLMLCLGTRW
jgi:hypothetical protein